MKASMVSTALLAATLAVPLQASADAFGSGLKGAAGGALFGAIIGGGKGAAGGALLGGLLGVVKGSADSDKRSVAAQEARARYERERLELERARHARGQ